MYPPILPMLRILSIVLTLKSVIHYFLKDHHEFIFKLTKLLLGEKLKKFFRILLKLNFECLKIEEINLFQEES